MRQKGLSFVVLLSCALLVVMAGCHTTGTAAEKDKVRADIDRVAAEGLTRLYDVHPKAQQAVKNAAGYAVFSNFGWKIFITGSAHGKGVAGNNRTRSRTYMKMHELQAGLGFGVEKYFFTVYMAGEFNTFIADSIQCAE